MPDSEKSKRITDIILKHWTEIKGDRLIPAERDIDLTFLGKIWDYCFFVQTRDILNEEKYNYTYLGCMIVNAYKEDLADIKDINLASPQAYKMHEAYKFVIEKKEPWVDEGEFEIKDHKIIRYRQCLVPLGDTDDKVESVLGGMRYEILNG